MTDCLAYQIESRVERANAQFMKMTMPELKKVAARIWERFGQGDAPHIYTKQSVNWMRNHEDLALNPVAKTVVGQTALFPMPSGRFDTGDILIMMGDRSAFTLIHEVVHAILYREQGASHCEHNDDFMDKMQEVLDGVNSTIAAQYRSVREQMS